MIITIFLAVAITGVLTKRVFTEHKDSSGMQVDREKSQINATGVLSDYQEDKKEFEADERTKQAEGAVDGGMEANKTADAENLTARHRSTPGETKSQYMEEAASPMSSDFGRLPAGSYNQSCGGCEMEGDGKTLTCSWCLDRHGRRGHETSLSDADTCSDIRNSGGILVCPGLYKTTPCMPCSDAASMASAIKSNSCSKSQAEMIIANLAGEAGDWRGLPRRVKCLPADTIAALRHQNPDGSAWWACDEFQRLVIEIKVGLHADTIFAIKDVFGSYKTRFVNTIANMEVCLSADTVAAIKSDAEKVVADIVAADTREGEFKAQFESLILSIK